MGVINSFIPLMRLFLLQELMNEQPILDEQCLMKPQQSVAEIDITAKHSQQLLLNKRYFPYFACIIF
jgi:hypothetical protein